ncbi:MAG: TraR/DksA C4-type zinc finger protein [Acidimicrobiia bacterium]|nr:TraR/DksA C4-type zinc finger protein [Acidimicrobiia bacterium]
MTSIDYEAKRTRLEEERDELTVRLQDLGITHGGGSHDVGEGEGFADSGAVSAERRELLTLQGSLRENLDDVEAALARITAGTYGICEKCEGPIAPERLEVLPSARLCVACAADA